MKTTKEELKAEALKYETRGAFARGNPSKYNLSLRHPDKEEIFSHMVKAKMGRWCIWDHSTVKVESELYRSRAEFALGSGAAYHYALRNGLLGELFPNRNQE